MAGSDDGRPAQQAGHAARGRDLAAARQPLHEPLSQVLAADRAGAKAQGLRGRLRGRLRDPLPRTCGGGEGVGAGGHDPPGADAQRSQDLGSRNAWRERFNFLGYSFGPHYSPKDGPKYLGASPSAKSVARLKPRTSAILRPGNTKPWGDVRVELNRMLKGWAGSFRYGTRSPAYSAIDHHVAARVRHFLTRRHKVPLLGTRRFSDETIFGRLGVIRLRKLARTPPTWASA